MIELNNMLKQFVKSGVLTEEAVVTISNEFDSAVKEKAESELFNKVTAMKTKITEEEKKKLQKDFRAKEIKILEEAEKYIDKSVEEKTKVVEEQLKTEYSVKQEELSKRIADVNNHQVETTAKMKTFLNDKVANLTKKTEDYKVVLEEEVIKTVQSYIKTEILPKVDSIIIEEELTKSKRKLLEESQAKDDAITQLTEITNKLAKVIKTNKADSDSQYLRKVRENKILEEELQRRLSQDNQNLYNYKRVIIEESFSYDEVVDKIMAIEDKGIQKEALKSLGKMDISKPINLDSFSPEIKEIISGEEFDPLASIEEYKPTAEELAEFSEQGPKGFETLGFDFDDKSVKTLLDVIKGIAKWSSKDSETLVKDLGVDANNAAEVKETLGDYLRDIEIPANYFWSGNKEYAEGRPELLDIETAPLGQKGEYVMEKLLEAPEFADYIWDTYDDLIEYLKEINLDEGKIYSAITPKAKGTGRGGKREGAGFRGANKQGIDTRSEETVRTGKTAFDRQSVTEQKLRQERRLLKEQKRNEHARLKMEQLKLEITHMQEEEKKNLIANKMIDKRRKGIIQEARSFFIEKKKEEIKRVKMIEESKRLKIILEQKAKKAEELKIKLLKEEELKKVQLLEEARKKELADKVSTFVEESVKGLNENQASEVKRRLKGKKFTEIKDSIRSVIRDVVEEGMRNRIDRKRKLEKNNVGVGRGLVQEDLRPQSVIVKPQLDEDDPYSQAADMV